MDPSKRNQSRRDGRILRADMPKKKYSREDASLETLLDLGGEIFPEEILE